MIITPSSSGSSSTRTVDLGLLNTEHEGITVLRHAAGNYLCITQKFFVTPPTSPCNIPEDLTSSNNVATCNKAMWSERIKVKWNEVKWSEVGGGPVFMEKVYRNNKWWKVKDWGESVSELMIVKKKLQKTTRSTLLLRVFTFCTCCKILICLVCFDASFKLSFV